MNFHGGIIVAARHADLRTSEIADALEIYTEFTQNGAKKSFK